MEPIKGVAEIPSLLAAWSNKWILRSTPYCCSTLISITHSHFLHFCRAKEVCRKMGLLNVWFATLLCQEKGHFCVLWLRLLPSVSCLQARITTRLQQYRTKAELSRNTRPQAWVPREKLPRPLTSSASAIRKLMRKAELMGISTDIFPVDTSDASASLDGRRKHKQPALSAEFVNYYLGEELIRLQKYSHHVGTWVPRQYHQKGAVFTPPWSFHHFGVMVSLRCSALFPQPELKLVNVLFCWGERGIALFSLLPPFTFQVGVPERLHLLRSVTTDKKSTSKLNK